MRRVLLMYLSNQVVSQSFAYLGSLLFLWPGRFSPRTGTRMTGFFIQRAKLLCLLHKFTATGMEVVLLMSFSLDGNRRGATRLGGGGGVLWKAVYSFHRAGLSARPN